MDMAFFTMTQRELSEQDRHNPPITRIASTVNLLIKKNQKAKNTLKILCNSIY